MDIDNKVEAARIGGAIGFTAAYGITLNDVVAAMTILYLGAQFIILLPKVKITIQSWIQWARTKVNKWL